MTKPKRYWLLADGKTVREISKEKLWELGWKYPNRNHLIVRVWLNEVWLRKGKDTIWVRRKQLEQILKREEGER